MTSEISTTQRTLCGIANVHKPAGMTSRDVVNVVGRLVGGARVGHAGTLDPLATGVLVVCIGAATRLIDYVQRLPKRYRATFLLGRTSPTEDSEGEITLLADAPCPTIEEIAQSAARWTGEILQRPPIYSALKVDGRRAYNLARAGREVTLAPRKIVIHSIDIVSYTYPELVLDVRCGAGTYIRSLGRDIAASLGTGAVMSGLVRTEIGHFHLDDACPCARLAPEGVARWLRPALDAVRTLPRVPLTAAQLAEVAHGRLISLPPETAGAEGELAATTPAGELAAILVQRRPGAFGPRINLAG